MTSKTTRRFRQMLAALPQELRSQAREAYRLFRENPHHPGLQFKKVHVTEPIYSVRITLDYRAVGVVDGAEIVWFWIGPYREYELLAASTLGPNKRIQATGNKLRSYLAPLIPRG
jgi:hypothetical protein